MFLRSARDFLTFIPTVFFTVSSLSTLPSSFSRSPSLLPTHSVDSFSPPHPVSVDSSSPPHRRRGGVLLTPRPWFSRSWVSSRVFHRDSTSYRNKVNKVGERNRGWGKIRERPAPRPPAGGGGGGGHRNKGFPLLARRRRWLQMKHSVLQPDWTTRSLVSQK